MASYHSFGPQKKQPPGFFEKKYYFSPFLLKRQLETSEDLAQYERLSESTCPNLKTLVELIKYPILVYGKKNQEKCLIWTDPVNISLLMLDLELFRLENFTHQDLIVFHKLYFMKVIKNHKFVTRSMKQLSRINQYCYFLNDMSMSMYNILSETTNIFSTNINLLRNEKIYLSFLNIHNAHNRSQTY